MNTSLAVKIELYPCVFCGTLTDWDFDLGKDTICVDCWDNITDIDKAIERRRQRDAAKEEYNAQRREYYRHNNEKLCARHRVWRAAKKLEAKSSAKKL